MQLTLGDLQAAQEPLESLRDDKILARTAYHLARIVRQIAPELQDYEIARKVLLERFGVLSEDETRYVIAPERQKEFNTEIIALLTTEVELDIAQIDEGDMPELTYDEALRLWWLVKGNEPPVREGSEPQDD